ncbi:MAG: hypothetical protein KAI72_01935 [Candidatus Pacebacteria bacterium]|nr:hypothetical protein [Candidatus Omnitrophota bacterium]MCK5590693.1 hypothetical protein [Candidatus Paceibacterota bacterium]
MTTAVDLLKAKHCGIREYKEHLSTTLLKDFVVITDRGKPVSVNLPYEEVLEMLDIFDEILDPETVSDVLEGRESIKSGGKGIPVSNLFNRLRNET